jgi:uncharacterized membrane protein
MTTRHALYVCAALCAAGLLVSLLLYPALPEQIPIHWDLHGNVDGWGDKRWAAFFGPAAGAATAALLFLLPYVSPRPFTVESFRGTFNFAVVIVTGMFLFIHLVMLQAALRPDLDSGRVLIAGIFFALAALGNILGRVRRNFWIGIRTPWTLASERVWERSHRLAARILTAAGLLGGAAVLAGAPPAGCLALLLAALFVPAVHSLLLYKRLEREGDLE